MTITAKVIARSVSEEGKEIATVQCRYPKFIHGEVMTHRVFSRNASSSRAIPVERLIRDVMEDPVEPMYWGKNQPGMQAAEELTGDALHMARVFWHSSRANAINTAQDMANLGAHKQIVNRIIEPYCHINTLITATEWGNFSALRCHPAAQPEMRMLAEAIRDALAASAPVMLKAGEWHLPYVWDVNLPDQISPSDDWSDYIKLSTARCARVSYLTQDGRREPSVEEDLALYARLANAVPMHASPMEHQATPDRNVGDVVSGDRWSRPSLHGNFVGWIQNRKLLESGSS